MTASTEVLNTTTTASGKRQFVSSVLENANKNESVKQALSLLLSTYGSTKQILPSAITTKLEGIEVYVAAVDKEAIVNSLDDTVDTVYTFGEQVVTAQKEKKLAEFITNKVLDVAEEILPVEESAAEKSDKAAPSSARFVSLGNNVSKKVSKQITDGLINVRERTTKVVHVDLISYAGEFIDNQVKPNVAYVSGLPKEVSDKFTSNVDFVKAAAGSTQARVSANVTALYGEVHTRVIDVATEVLNSNKSEPETVRATLLVSALAHQGRLAWNDFFVLPLSQYLALPDLKPVTLYNAALQSQTFATLTSYYNTVNTKVTETYAFTLTLPATISTKTVTELSERYLEFTGKAFDVNTAATVLFETAKVKGYSFLLFANDVTKGYITKTSPYLPAFLLQSFPLLAQYASVAAPVAASVVATEEKVN